MVQRSIQVEDAAKWSLISNFKIILAHMDWLDWPLFPLLRLDIFWSVQPIIPLPDTLGCGVVYAIYICYLEAIRALRMINNIDLRNVLKDWSWQNEYAFMSLGEIMLCTTFEIFISTTDKSANLFYLYPIAWWFVL